MTKRYDDDFTGAIFIAVFNKIISMSLGDIDIDIDRD